MEGIVLHERILENKDWATLVFTLCLTLIVITKTAFENRFNEFTRLLFSDKYIKIYRENTSVLAWFTLLLFIVQLVSFSFFILYLMSYFGMTSKSDWVMYIRIITFLSYFILAKYLFEKIIATSFNVEDFKENFDMLKISYRTYMGLLLVPVTLVLYYNNEPSLLIIYGIIGFCCFQTCYCI